MNMPTLAISDHRFRTPLTVDDELRPLSCEEGDIDLFALKSRAEESAYDCARKIIDQGGSDEELVFKFLADRRYRRGSNGLCASIRERCFGQIQDTVREMRRITLVISFMPVKVRHPLKTFAVEGSELDIGDVAALLRMYEVAYGLSRIHPYGAHVIIASDGARYQEVFGYGEEEHQKYRENLHKALRFLGINHYVSILDESTLYPPEFADVQSRCRQEVRELFDAGDADVQNLAAQMQSTITLSTYVDASTTPRALALALNHQLTDDTLAKISADVRELREHIRSRSLDTTLHYIATNRAVVECDIFRRGLPHAVKATVHPKPGQPGLHMINTSNSIFPYHGQGHGRSMEQPQCIDDVRVSFAIDLLRENTQNRYRGIILPTNRYPFSNGIHPFCVVRND